MRRSVLGVMTGIDIGFCHQLLLDREVVANVVAQVLEGLIHDRAAIACRIVQTIDQAEQLLMLPVDLRQARVVIQYPSGSLPCTDSPHIIQT